MWGPMTCQQVWCGKPLWHHKWACQPRCVLSRSVHRHNKEWMDWMESVYEQQFSSLATDAQLDLGLDFDHSNTWIFFDLNHSIVALALSLGSWKMDLLMNIHLPINTDQLPCPCWRKAYLQHHVATTMFHSGDGVFRVMSSDSFLPHIALCFQAKKFNFCLIWPKHLLHSLRCPLHGLWQTAKRTSYAFLSALAFFLPLFYKGQICVQLIVDLWTDSPTWAVDFCSSSRETMDLLAAPLTSALFARSVSLGGRPCLDRFAVVLCFFHFWMMDWTVLLELFKAWDMFW